MIREIFFGTFLLILVVLVLANPKSFQNILNNLTINYQKGVGAFTEASGNISKSKLGEG